MRRFRSAVGARGGSGPETTAVGALPEYSADAARDGFTFAKRRVRIYRAGFERCFARGGATRSPGCVVPFPARGGGYADDSGGSGTGIECEDVRFAGAAAGRRAWAVGDEFAGAGGCQTDRKSTRLNSSHLVISYAVFCL